jgi:hypothetical protein
MRAGRPLWARPAELYCLPQMSRRQAAATDNREEATIWQPCARRGLNCRKAHGRRAQRLKDRG